MREDTWWQGGGQEKKIEGPRRFRLIGNQGEKSEMPFWGNAQEKEDGRYQKMHPRLVGLRSK